MREILFRGKRIDNGEWVEGSLICWNDGSCVIETGNLSEPQYSVDPETVGQYTELNANGKKIFEGDILRFGYTGKNRGVDGVAAVIFEDGKFGVKWGWHSELVTLTGFANTSVEIIGNIHDRPELLEGGNT